MCPFFISDHMTALIHSRTYLYTDDVGAIYCIVCLLSAQCYLWMPWAYGRTDRKSKRDEGKEFGILNENPLITTNGEMSLGKKIYDSANQFHRNQIPLWNFPQCHLFRMWKQSCLFSNLSKLLTKIFSRFGQNLSFLWNLSIKNVLTSGKKSLSKSFKEKASNLHCLENNHQRWLKFTCT